MSRKEIVRKTSRSSLSLSRAELFDYGTGFSADSNTDVTSNCVDSFLEPELCHQSPRRRGSYCSHCRKIHSCLKNPNPEGFEKNFLPRNLVSRRNEKQKQKISQSIANKTADNSQTNSTLLFIHGKNINESFQTSESNYIASNSNNQTFTATDSGENVSQAEIERCAYSLEGKQRVTFCTACDILGRRSVRSAKHNDDSKKFSIKIVMPSTA